MPLYEKYEEKKTSISNLRTMDHLKVKNGHIEMVLKGIPVKKPSNGSILISNE